MLLRLTLAATLLGTAAFAQEDPLPSWNDGPTKQAILDFVSAATTEGGPDWIAPGDRIATFDNDGTLWSEQPMYFQGMFINDRIKALAADHPDWASDHALQGGARRRHGRPRRRRREGPRRTPRRHPRRHDQRGVRGDREGLDRHRPPPALRPPLHRPRLPADAGGARLPARQRLPDLDRLRRRHRLHAPLGRSGLRHPALAGHRQPDRSRLQRQGRPAPLRPRARASSSSTTRRASPSASCATSAASR